MIKIRITHSFIYLFLVWNLFLAVIPFIISTYLISTPKLNKLMVLLWCLVWLLFLPNAPYIVTDLLHLNNGDSKLLWLDVLVISSFAFNGLILFYYSLIDIKEILSHRFNIKFPKSLTLCILFLSSFGVYLGRFLRYNSWEIIQKPINLFKDIIQIIFHPNQNAEAWLFTLLFGTFLTVGYYCFSNNRAFME
ncbi:DUF1361 domain-containing protein [Seonamhaeicola marinus]|nr:DUF1361 domain-containing protein [Seonamhaeicola marinus]